MNPYPERRAAPRGYVWCSPAVAPVSRAWFAEIQRRCLDRGVFCSLEDLTTALQEWIKLWNDSARPFKWTKTPDQIIDSICRYCDPISPPAYQRGWRSWGAWRSSWARSAAVTNSPLEPR